MKRILALSRIQVTLFLTILPVAFLAGCGQPATTQPLYFLASYDANGDGKFDQDLVGEEGQAIYALQLQGDDTRIGQLTDPTAYLPDMFTVSPDGKYLAFTTKPSADHIIGSYIYIIDLSNSTITEIPYEASLVEGIYWSHGGGSPQDDNSMRLAALVTDTQGISEALIITQQATIERRVSSTSFLANEFQDYNPYVSPDRTQRIWPKAVEGGYLLSKTGIMDKYNASGPRLSDVPFNFIGWSPDSQRLLVLNRDLKILEQFRSLSEPHGALFTIDPKNNELTPLTAGGGATEIAAWSPVSRDIAYLTQLEDSDQDGIADAPLDAPVLYILSPDGKARRIDLGEKYQIGWGLDW